MDYYSCLTCVPSLKIQALFSAKQERASGIYPASGITPTYLNVILYMYDFFFVLVSGNASPSNENPNYSDMI